VEELTKQVKNEMIRTLIWIIIAMGIGIGVYCIIW
jgi:hypothetical protein